MPPRKSTRRASRSTPASSAPKAGGNAEKYQQLADRFIAALEAGTVPWQAPWITSGGLSRSMSSGKFYQGINVWLLALASMEHGYTSPWWGTYNQIAEKSGMVRGERFWTSPDDSPRGVRKGEKGTLITLWKTFQRTETDESGQRVTKTIPMLRFFSVFNADQADQLPAKYHPAPAEAGACEPIAAAEQVLGDYFASAGGPGLHFDVSAQAYFNHATDSVHIPPLAEHVSAERYYSTLAHEATHSTGHHTRLARRAAGEGRAFGSHDYGTEELTAEFGAALIMGTLGIDTAETFEQSAAYLASWIRKIREEPKMIVQAAAAAQRAVNLIMPQEASGATDAAEGDEGEALAA